MTRWMDGYTGGWMDEGTEHMEGNMDKWMDGWIDRRRDRWKNGGMAHTNGWKNALVDK